MTYAIYNCCTHGRLAKTLLADKTRQLAHSADRSKLSDVGFHVVCVKHELMTYDTSKDGFERWSSPDLTTSAWFDSLVQWLQFRRVDHSASWHVDELTCCCCIHWALTCARSVATPRPTSRLTANALSTHDVIVSGTVAVNVACPSALHISDTSRNKQRDSMF